MLYCITLSKMSIAFSSPAAQSRRTSQRKASPHLEWSEGQPEAQAEASGEGIRKVKATEEFRLPITYLIICQLWSSKAEDFDVVMTQLYSLLLLLQH